MPNNPQESHPLELVREEAAHTTPKAVRGQLDALSQEHAALAAATAWTAAAEETFRQVIGMERKSQLEMRVALGEAGAKYLRYTKGLGDMNLAELRAEYPETRRLTLALLDEVLNTSGATPWTLGEQVPANIYIVALRNRLTWLGEALNEVKGT